MTGKDVQTYQQIRKVVREEKISYLAKEREAQQVQSIIRSVMKLQADVDHSKPDDYVVSPDHQSLTTCLGGVSVQAYGDERTNSAMLYVAKKGKSTTFDDCAKAAAVICDYKGYDDREHIARCAADKVVTDVSQNHREIKSAYEVVTQ